MHLGRILHVKRYLGYFLFKPELAEVSMIMLYSAEVTVDFYATGSSEYKITFTSAGFCM